LHIGVAEGTNLFCHVLVAAGVKYMRAGSALEAFFSFEVN
jgi:hypothetical protein